MIILQTGKGNKLIGEMGLFHCDSCGQETKNAVFVHYNYVSFFFFFNFLSSRQYLRYCGACGAPTQGKRIKKPVSACIFGPYNRQ